MNKIHIHFLVFWILLTISIQSIGQQLIQNDTIWSSDTVRIYNDILLKYPATLSINPGVYLEFQGNYSIEVQGKILALGTEEYPITFTVSDTSDFSNISINAGGWGGIKLLDNSTDTSYFSFCNFSYGKACDTSNQSDRIASENLKGGAIYANGYANILFENCVFSNNMAYHSGGAIMAINLQNLSISNSLFDNNRVLEYGGALWLNNINNTIISKNIFKENRAIKFRETAWGTAISGAGAAMWLGAQTSNSLIISNFITNNISPNAAFYETNYKCNVFNNIIVNNRGPGIIIGHSVSISLYNNNTIVHNKGFFHNMCGILFFSQNITMRNNIVYGNTSDYYGFDPIQVYSPDPVLADFAYSCNPDEPVYYQGEGNIHEDPQFVNPTAGAGPDYDGLSADWSLLDSSPCVNTGTPDTTGLNLPATDLLGNPRIYGIRVDMGAIENQMVVGLPQNPLVNARVQVSPNPFGQSFKVVASGTDKISSISLFNQSGQQIATETMMPFEQMLVFDLRNQSPGLYLLVTHFADGSTETTKLVKY